MFASARQGPPAPPLSVGAKWRLLEMVYAQPQLLWANTAIILFVGMMCWVKTDSVLPLAWVAVGIALAALRLTDFHGFADRRMRETPAQVRRRFERGAWALAGLWGAASAVQLLTMERVPNLLTIAAQAGFLASAVARNNPMQRAALGQVYIMLAPLFVVCLVNPDPSVKICSLAVLIYLASSASTVRHLHRQSVRLIVADDENAALVRSVQSVNAELEAVNRLLEQVASTDALTGGANRRSFDIRLDAEWRGRPDPGTASSVGLMLIDIDHFKAYNDCYGHLAGDTCLRRVSHCIEASVRSPGDFTARYGGEEFAVILPQTEEADACAVAERIRATVEDMRLPNPWLNGGSVTVSIGVAVMQNGPDVAADLLIALADRRLYEAKRAGRNCVRSSADQWTEGGLPAHATAAS